MKRDTATTILYGIYRDRIGYAPAGIYPGGVYVQKYVHIFGKPVTRIHHPDEPDYCRGWVFRALGMDGVE